MKLLLFKVNHLGDSVVFIPVVQTLRRLHPDWHITVVAGRGEAELYGGPLGPQELLVSDLASFGTAHRRPWELVRWVLAARRRRPDACVLPFDQGNVAHLVAALSGARVRSGTRRNVRFAGSLTEEVPAPEDGSAASWNWSAMGAALKALGVSDWPEKPPAPDLSHLVPPKPKFRRHVVIHPGAAGLNRWPAERFTEVARILREHAAVDWIIHGNSLASSPEGVRFCDVRNLAGLVAHICPAALFLGNNSGPMHVANALGVPGVVVTGPSALGWDPHWHREKWTVLRHPGLYCAPCERLDSPVRACMNSSHPMACLDLLSARQVADVCLERLSQA